MWTDHDRKILKALEAATAAAQAAWDETHSTAHANARNNIIAARHKFTTDLRA
jgi:hypothetical protein